MLRQIISDMEREAYHAPNRDYIGKIKLKLQHTIKSEIQIKAYQHKNRGKLAQFDKMITHANALCEKTDNGDYQTKNVFQ